MAYTEVLNPATPADGDLLSAGDDSIRQFKRAIIERLLTIVVDVDANPLVIKPSALLASKKQRISHTAFQPRDDASSISRGVAALSPNSLTSLPVYGTMSFAPGFQLIKARLKVKSNHANAAVTGTLYRVFEGGGPDVVTTFTAALNGGVQTLEQTIAQNVLDGDLYTFHVVLDTTTAGAANDGQLFWAELEVA